MTGENKIENIRDMVESIAKNLVDKPKLVRVVLVQGEKSTIIEVHVDKSDIGKLIGKAGATATAFRRIVSSSSVKTNTRVLLEIADQK